MKACTKIFVLATVAIMVVPVLSFAGSFVDPSFNRRGTVETSMFTTGIGEFTLKLKDDSGQPINDGEWFTGFCVDPWQGAFIGTGELDVSFVSPSDHRDGLGLKTAWLFDSFYTEGSVGSAEIIGLQLAMWEVMVDDSFDLGTGGFFVKNGSQPEAVALATSYLGGLSQASFDDATIARLNSSYIIGTHGGRQDFIVKVGDPGAPVPEPGTVMLMSVGLLGLFGVSRKYKK